MFECVHPHRRVKGETMFDAIGVLVAAYTLYAAATGRVLARHLAWGRQVRRDEEPAYFWTVIAIYALLAAMLVFWF